VGEVYDRRETLSDWRESRRQPASTGDFLFTGKNSVRRGLRRPDPDEQHFHERLATKAASFERTYRRPPWCCGRVSGGRRPQPGGPGRHPALPGALTGAGADRGEGPASPRVA